MYNQKACLNMRCKLICLNTLSHDNHDTVDNKIGNVPNGKSRKTLKGEFGELPIEVPRDCEGSLESQLIPKHQTR
jgi:putative transposase